MTIQLAGLGQNRNVQNAFLAQAATASAAKKGTSSIDQGITPQVAPAAQSTLTSSQTTDAVNILKLTTPQLQSATVAQRMDMLTALDNRTGYWTGFAGVMGFIFVDLLLLGVIWNSRSIVRSPITDVDRQAALNILTTTPDSDTGNLVAQMYASGLTDRIIGDAPDTANFIHSNVQGLPVPQLANMLAGYSSTDAAAILNKVSLQRSPATVDQVAQGLISNGGMSQLLNGYDIAYSAANASSAADIMNPTDLRSAMTTRYTNDFNSMKSNPVYQALPPASIALVSAKFEAAHNVDAMVAAYNPQVAAQAAVDHVQNLNDLADILKKSTAVISAAFTQQLTNTIVTSPAFTNLFPFLYVAYNPGVCTSEAQYEQIVNMMDNFDANFRTPDNQALADFLTRAGLTGTAVASTLQTRLNTGLSALFNQVAQIKETAYEQLVAEDNREFQAQESQLTNQIQNDDNQLANLQTQRNQQVAAGQSTTAIDQQIANLRLAEAKTDGELTELQKQGPVVPIRR